MKIEDALKQLEIIAQKLEDGNVGLDESLKLFEEGTRLAETCSKILAEGKGKLVQIKEKFDKISEEKFELAD